MSHKISKMNRVGIDVGKDILVIEMKAGADGRTAKGEFDNNPSGHKKLLKFITKHGHHAKVCMEATGNYHFELALLLAKSDKVTVMVVNPKAMHHFATAILQRAKTDRYDAHVILEYLCRMDFIEWNAPSDTKIKIHRYARRLSQLKKMKTQEQSRRSAAEFQGKDGKDIIKSIDKIIANIDKQITKIQASAVSIINNDPELQEIYSRLTSATGIAEVSAVQLLSEFVMLPDGLTAEQGVAFAGLDPKPIESGTSVNKPRHISRHGNAHIRAALYMPALVAIRHDTHVRAYYEKLLAAGKKKMQAIVAVMRKLLLAFWGMLNSKKNWDGNKFYKIENID